MWMCVVDVDVPTPDKKSVMMYVMCYFQVLPHSDINMDEAVEEAAAGGMKEDVSTHCALDIIGVNSNTLGGKFFFFTKCAAFCNKKIHSKIYLFVAHMVILGAFHFFGLKGFQIVFLVRSQMRTAHQNGNPSNIL